ncbi:MAG: hypothetical protein V4553_17545 [Bacteroidota bacterium]
MNFNTDRTQDSPELRFPGQKHQRKIRPLLVLLTMALTPLVYLTACKKTDLSTQVVANIKNTGGHLATNSLTGTDFNIVLMPDIQYFTSVKNGGTVAMLDSEIVWIKRHQIDSNIVYVGGLGDITDDANISAQWVNAKNEYYKLETPTTGFPNGIPYGLAVGNHDQWPENGQSVTDVTTLYNTYFGTSHFAGRSYYGGAYTGGNGGNDSHFDLFSAGGKDWIVVYIEFDSGNENWAGMETWAFNTVNTYASRKAIIISHGIMDNTFNGSGFLNQGQDIYNKLKNCANVCLFFCGHIGDEGYRRDVSAGHTIQTMLADYQFHLNGGDGYMRLMHFSVDNDRIGVRTYSPKTGIFQFGQFTKSLFHDAGKTRTCDFNNSGKSRLSFYNAGTWKVNGLSNVTAGGASDIPAQGDYNGDGETDYVYWTTGGVWTNLPGGGTHTYGVTGDIPTPGDYDGDGITDLSVYRPSTATWFAFLSTTNAGTSVVVGSNGDIPVPGDYDGDGKTDKATWTQSTGTWHIKSSITGTVTNTIYGQAGDIPVPGDYNGDGKTDMAVYRGGVWFVAAQPPNITWGGNVGDIPAPGDYNGDGITDKAYYRGGTLFVSGGTNVTFGGAGDKLLNLPYAIRNVYFP